jgi:hypothetical protein
MGVREDPRVILVCLWAEAVKDKARRRNKMIGAMDRDLALVWHGSVNLRMSIVPALQSLSLVSSSQARQLKTSKSSHKIHRVSLPIVGNPCCHFYAFKVNAAKSLKKLGNYLALVHFFHHTIPHLNSHLLISHGLFLVLIFCSRFFFICQVPSIGFDNTIFSFLQTAWTAWEMPIVALMLIPRHNTRARQNNLIILMSLDAKG